MRPVALIQHDRTQRPGHLLNLLHQWDVPTRCFLPEEGESVPHHARDFSGIVLLGSNHSVNEPVSWIKAERALVLDAMHADVPLLGHCFGAQQMARALGAPVCRNAWPNIGWSRLTPTPAGRMLLGDEPVRAFNWHYETFGIPSGAQRLLFGRHCINKGFRIGKHLAFQCHFEVTEEIVREWCRTARNELAQASGPAVQCEAQILGALPAILPGLRATAERVYRQWATHLRRAPTLALTARGLKVI